MLSAKPQLNLRSAREYFREHLRVGDYYAAGQTVAGEWFGVGAEKLGMKGKVGEDAFLALCEGLRPDSRERLTARKNSTRKTETGQAANRRVFYDFTFSPPKSVSVVGLYQDDRILMLHDRAVRVALTELEKFAETRVRRTGEDAERETGNLVGALFRHDTSRELDPHLHTHCVLFNATFDPVEKRWKALQAGSMYQAQKFAENLYYHELAKGLRGLGYDITNNARDFEIRQVPKAVIDHFSKRHRHIDEETRKEIERAGLHGNVKALRRQTEQKRAHAYIEAHLEQKFCVASLAKHMATSLPHLNRRFRATFGMPPLQYALRLRVDKALDLLRGGNTRVAEAAFSVGFCDQSHFDRHCRKFYGFPPGSLLRAAR